MEGQIPGGIPWVLPFVGHRDDVVMDHMEPLLVSALTARGRQRIGPTFLQPLFHVESVILLGPKHASQRLAHYPGALFADRRWGDRTEELVGFVAARGQHPVKMAAQPV